MFKRIGLIAKQQTANVANAIDLVTNYLTKLNVPVILEQETSRIMKNCKFPTVAQHELNKFCDLLVVIGGDGRLLSASRSAAKQNLPVVGINLGTLGFLADIPLQNIKKINDIIQGEHYEEQRFLLETEIYSTPTDFHGTAHLETSDCSEHHQQQHNLASTQNAQSACDQSKLIAHDIALNDIILTAVTAGKMIEFALYIDNKLVCSYRADGIIISTPTGSTAHALSGGGPIIHPSLQSLAIVPMFSHNLSSRPIVINANSTLKLSPINNKPIKITCDGQNEIAVPSAGNIIIKKAHEKLRLIHPKDYDYFNSLRVKLGWEK